MNPRRLRGLNIAAGLVYAFLATPVLVVLIASVTAEDFVTFPPRGITLRWYLAIGSRPEFVDSLLISLGVAGAVAPLAALLGTLAAIALVRYEFRGKSAIVSFLLSPLIVPAIMTSIALLQFLILAGIGVSIPALILGHTLITTPYTVRLVAASLVSANPHCERAAQNLGASALQVFRYVTLPSIRPGLIGGTVLAFLISFDDVTVSLFLSTPTLVTLPVRIFTFIDNAMSPMITAVSSLMILISLAGILLVERLFGLRRAFGAAEDVGAGRLRALGPA